MKYNLHTFQGFLEEGINAELDVCASKHVLIYIVSLGLEENVTFIVL